MISKSQRPKAHTSGLFRKPWFSRSLHCCKHKHYKWDQVSLFFFFLLEFCLLSTAGSKQLGPKLFRTNTIPIKKGPKPTAVFDWLKLHRVPVTDWTAVITTSPTATLIGKHILLKMYFIWNLWDISVTFYLRLNKTHFVSN